MLLNTYRHLEQLLPRALSRFKKMSQPLHDSYLSLLGLYHPVMTEGNVHLGKG